MNKSISYELILERIQVEDTSVMSYGISCIEKNTIKTEIHNISVDKTLVENLIKACNELDLSPMHLFDIVEDSLII